MTLQLFEYKHTHARLFKKNSNELARKAHHAAMKTGKN
jgi:hypothetical protein